MTIQLAEPGLDALFGAHDENLRRLEEAFGVSVQARGESVSVSGEPEAAALVERALGELSELARSGHRIRGREVRTAIRVLQDAPETSLVDFFAGGQIPPEVRRLINPRTANQFRYLQAMMENDLVISTGPAGTGKTYLAVAMAASALMEKRVRRILLCRPAVEAGEKLGFLPGDLVEKVNPYLRPLYDALYDIIGYDKVGRMLERGIIEVAPIAFMRGRTLNDAFIILDEAQNTTSEQMKMFLTRIGFNSRAVINGDVTQIDLPSGRASGLREAVSILAGIPGISFIEFERGDVVRHPLVQKVVAAYERFEQEKARAEARPPR